MKCIGNDFVLFVARLRNSLPQMVIDILEEKMEQEYRFGALSLLKEINNTQVPTEDDNDDAGVIVKTPTVS